MISPELHVIRCMNSGICCIKQNCIPENFKDAVMIIYAFDVLLSVCYKAQTTAILGRLSMAVVCAVVRDVYVVYKKLT